jgi:predicted  nucleic acid-binding Zn-ribbon protein
LEFKGQLIQLVRLQDLVLESRAASRLVEDSPARIEEIEEQFRERNAEYVAVKQRFDALEEDQRLRTGELQELEEHHKKYKTDLMQVQNQREYAAMLREIDAIKASISEHESAILRDMEEIESTKSDLSSHEEHINAERIAVGKQRTEVEGASEVARQKIEQLSTERTTIEATLPRILRQAVARLEAGRAGQFMARAADGCCQSCYVRLRPQMFQEIRNASKIHYCSNCKRLLFHEPSLVPAAEKKEDAVAQESATPTDPESASETESGGPAENKDPSGNVEAVNGGAV